MASTAHSVVEDRTPVSSTQLEAVSKALGEGPELLSLRRRALDVFERAAAPDRADHLWRFTSPKKLMPATVGPGEMWITTDPSSLEDVTALIELTPGGAPSIRLGPAGEAAGLVVEPFGSPFGLGRTVPAEHGLFEALNLAAYNAGVVVRVPTGATLERPIRILAAAGAGTFLPRIVIEAGAGSVATVVEEHVGGGESSNRIGVTEVNVAEDVRLEHVLVQRMASQSRGHLTVRSHAGAGASVVTVLLALGGEVVKVDLGTRLEGERASSEMLGFLLAEGGQHLDHHTVHHHVAPHTASNIDFKVALNGRARSVYTGTIRIDEEARTSEAYQENRNLLLSEHSRADTIPELEILNEDVQCTHGATVAPISEEQVFYLQSRGIPADEASRLIVKGFLEGTLQRIPEAVRKTVEPLIEARLAAFEGGHR